MLTDIFAARYAAVPLVQTFTGRRTADCWCRRFAILFRGCSVTISDGKEIPYAKAFWTDIHAKLTREVGLTELSALNYYSVAKTYVPWPMVKVCQDWMLDAYNGSVSPDLFVKERLSLIELGFRKREDEIAAANAHFLKQLAEAQAAKTVKLPNFFGHARTVNAALNQKFDAPVAELNERFRQAGYNLHYHNGFIQRTTDDFTSQHIETPFWALVADPKWENVEHGT